MTSINSVSDTDILTFSLYGNIDEYQRLATRSAIYPGRGTPLGLTYVALKLNGEAGELAEHVGKAMRDDDYFQLATRMEGEGVSRLPVMRVEGELTPSRREAIIKEAGDVLWYLSAVANELSMTVSEIAAANLTKLASRTRRDTLRGSGDNR